MDILIKKSRMSSWYKKNEEKKFKKAALEWDDLDMQAELKSFMYVDR